MASQSWQPDDDTVHQLVGYLNESLSGSDRNVRNQAETMLKKAKASESFDNYLCYLLCGPPASLISRYDVNHLHAARAAAGIMLKNDVKTNYRTMPQSSRNFIRTNIFLGFQDPNAKIRNYVGLVLAELVRQSTLRSWPDALYQLVAMAGNEDGSTSVGAQEGAAVALRNICEDNSKAFMEQFDGDTGMLRYMVQKLTDLMISSSAKVRANAVASLSFFIIDKSDTILQNISEVLKRLLALATDPDDNVRKFMCRAIVQVAEAEPNAILDVFDGLVDFMISQQQGQEDPELAVDAAEFWLFAADNPKTADRLGRHVPKLVPVLLENMVYTEDDVLRLENDVDDADLEDRQEDIKPQFASSKSGRAAAVAGENGDATKESADDDDMSEGEIEESDADDDLDDPEEQWTLRKCSAASLDTLSTLFPNEVFEATLPYLQENLTHDQWPNREAAVLAIGAIADGCMDYLKPHLPNLIPFLVQLLNDKQAIVRQITCWSLGRYSVWASHLDAANKTQFFVPMMDGLLKRMLDGNKRVQEAAASAFASLEEKANVELADPAYCRVIVAQFAQCFAKYKERSIFILYDCVQTLTEHVAPALQSKDIINDLMPSLYTRWKKVGDNDQEMFPLLECLSYVATSLGDLFTPYAQEMFPRCVSIIYNNLQNSIIAREDPEMDSPSPDFLVTSLDLLSAIIQALGEKASVLIKQTNPSLFELLRYCLEDEDGDVRQSGYALLGDSAIHVFTDLQNALDEIMPILIKQLDSPKATPGASEHGFAVTNNACWSCGEITMRAGSKMEPFAEYLMKDFFSILTDDKLPASLHDNAALALGRLGNGCADKMAPHLAHLGPYFFRRMHLIGWEDEKCHAMRGISEVILRNPEASQDFLMDYINEIGSASASEISTEPKFRGSQGPYELFQKVLTTFAQNIPNFQQAYLSHLPPTYTRAIQSQYTI